MSFTIRRAAVTSICLAAVAALAPIACSSKTPDADGGTITGCSSDAMCENGYCDNGVCHPRCIAANNDCPPGQTCNADGRCGSPSGGAGGTSGSGGTSGTSTGGTTIIPPSDAGPDANDGALNPDAACGAETEEATLTPVSMFVMFDRSGSMVMNQQPPTRWDNAALALTSFFQDPGAADLAVALRFFPHDNPAMGCTNDSTAGCSATACAQPLVPLMADPMVPLAKLTADPAPMDAHEEALIAAVMAAAPMTGGMGMMGGGNSGGTPTHVALQGALEWATAYQAAHPRPEQQTVVVLVTDGQPNGCGNNCGGGGMGGGDQTACFAGIQMLAADALAAAGIRTYVVGLTNDPEDLAFLEDLAVVGGTERAFIVQDGATAAMELADTLKAIQGNALSCDFAYPMVADGGMADPAKINVDFTPGAGGAPVPFYQVENEAACGSSALPSWYYDDPAAPTRIFLCPNTCAMVTADTGMTKIEIAIGCTSRPRPET